MSRIQGIIPPVITPILENEHVDEVSLRTIISSCAEERLHGVFVAGSGGETMALTQAQRERAIAIALDEAAGRIPVLCGAMDASTNKVVEHIRRIEQMGGEVAVVTPVFYTKTTNQDDIVRHFEEICRRTTIDIMVYNIPANTQVFMTADTIARVLSLDCVIGVKDSSGNWAHFQKCLSTVRRRGNQSLFQGITEIAGTSILCGADGFIPIYSIFFPKLYLRLYEAARNADISLTLHLQHMANELSERLTVRGHVVLGAKTIAGAFGMGTSRLCEPYVKLPAGESERLQQLALHYARTIRQADDFADPDMWAEMFGADSRIVAG